MVGEKRVKVFAANTFLLFEEISYFSFTKAGLFNCLCALK